MFVVGCKCAAHGSAFSLHFTPSRGKEARKNPTSSSQHDAAQRQQRRLNVTYTSSAGFKKAAAAVVERANGAMTS
jgi:hypothetical protein